MRHVSSESNVRLNLLKPLGPVHAACFMSRKQQLFLPQVFSGDSHTIAEAFRLLPDRFWMTLQPFLSCLRWPFGWLPVR